MTGPYRNCNLGEELVVLKESSSSAPKTRKDSHGLLIKKRYAARKKTK